MKLAFCNETFEHWEFARVCGFLAETGYDGVELAPFTFAEDPSTLDDAWAQETGAIARRAGLEIVGLHWLLLKPEGLHLTTPENEVRARTVAFVQHLARLCAAAGGEVLVWGSPAQRSVQAGDSFTTARARAVEAIREVCEVAGEVGVDVCLEPLAPRLTDFLNTAEDTVRLIQDVDHPSCRLHLDVAAMSTESVAMPDLIRQHHTHLRHFHANDPCLLGPGSGDVDYAPLVQALRAVDYQGYLSVEVFLPGPGPEDIARESLSYLKRVITAEEPA